MTLLHIITRINDIIAGIIIRYIYIYIYIYNRIVSDRQQQPIVPHPPKVGRAMAVISVDSSTQPASKVVVAVAIEAAAVAVVVVVVVVVVGGG